MCILFLFVYFCLCQMYKLFMEKKGLKVYVFEKVPFVIGVKGREREGGERT